MSESQNSFFIILILGILGIYIVRALRSPFHYPYFKYSFDISGKRNIKYEDLIDQFLLDNGFCVIENHWNKVTAWEERCQKFIASCFLKRLRMKQFNTVNDSDNMFQFFFERGQTRYKQINYQKYAYRCSVTEYIFSCDYYYLQERWQKLQDIGLECTLREYETKNQRALMTRELREQIMKRDNYTCQLCGKYMPDEVGLHIDHIIPVSKGGKSIPSNLQVLCSKCNGHKSNK